jgi:hypothetical protein
MGRETSTLQLLVPLLLTGGKGADLVIRGNVVLNSSNTIKITLAFETSTDMLLTLKLTNILISESRMSESGVSENILSGWMIGWPRASVHGPSND